MKIIVKKIDFIYFRKYLLWYKSNRIFCSWLYINCIIYWINKKEYAFLLINMLDLFIWHVFYI